MKQIKESPEYWAGWAWSYSRHREAEKAGIAARKSAHLAFELNPELREP